jgi:hypothetical protein
VTTEPMKRVYVVSPLRASKTRTLVQNTLLVKALCHEVALAGHAVFAPHLLYPLFLDDTIPEERALGISMGLAWLDAVDEVWVYTLYGVSEGMRAEVAYAKALGKKIVYPIGWDGLS